MERRLRIGELAQRIGMTPDVLRAWERRYGLLEPERSAGGYRLYTPADEQRVVAMQRYLDAGVPAGEAARLVLEGGELPEADSPWLPDLGAELREALDQFDEGRAQAALDMLLSKLSFDAVARDVMLPYLRELGERWDRGDASVAQEHFASTILRGRLMALARGWDRGIGPRALLACAPGERHDLGLILFGLALRQQGWRITYLGADTPTDTLAAAAKQIDPVVVVLVALTADWLEPVRGTLKRLARDHRLLLGGAGADQRFASSIGAELLPQDPLAAVELLSSEPRGTAA